MIVSSSALRTAGLVLDTKFVYTGQSILENVQGAVRYNRYQYDFIDGEIEGLKKKKGIKVVDFGAGIGTHTDMFKDDTRLAIDCVEPDSQQARILKQKGYVVYKDIQDVKQRYDVIYALNVFEHIKDDAGVLAQIKSLVADGGIIVIYVPAFMLIPKKSSLTLQWSAKLKGKTTHDIVSYLMYNAFDGCLVIPLQYK